MEACHKLTSPGRWLYDVSITIQRARLENFAWGNHLTNPSHTESYQEERINRNEESKISKRVKYSRYS